MGDDTAATLDAFLNAVKESQDLQDALRGASPAEVVAIAAQHGYVLDEETLAEGFVRWRRGD